MLGGVQQNWAGQCKIVGGVGLIPAVGLGSPLSFPAGPERSTCEGPGGRSL